MSCTTIDQPSAGLLGRVLPRLRLSKFAPSCSRGTEVFNVFEHRVNTGGKAQRAPFAFFLYRYIGEVVQRKGLETSNGTQD